VSLSITVDDVRLNTALERLERVYSDPRPAFRPMAEQVVKMARAQMDSAGRHSGRPWAARAPSTMRSITSANRGGFRSVGLPLHATGRLFRGVGTFGGPDSIYREERDGVTVGTSVPYARFHQTGTRRMPQRKIYDPTDRDIREIIAAGKRSFRERIEPLGFEYSDGGEIPF
jgi:phage gpG-like protein